MKTFASLAVISMMVVSCGNAEEKGAERKNGYSEEPKTSIDSLYKQVMDGHDVGMAKMGALRKYNGIAQAQIDSIQKLPPAKQDKAYLTELTTLKEMLTSAEKGMNDWMNDFNLDSAQGPGASERYLKGQVPVVETVKHNILNSLQKADSLLKK